MELILDGKTGFKRNGFSPFSAESESEKEKHEIHARFYLSKIKARNFIRNNHIQYQLKEQEVNSTDMPRIA